MMKTTGIIYEFAKLVDLFSDRVLDLEDGPMIVWLMRLRLIPGI